MRHSITLGFFLLLISPQVHACRGASVEDTLFFKSIPDPQPDADLIANVSLSTVNHGKAVARIKQVLKTSDARVHRGNKISMKYGFSSCGPHHKSGDEGMIIAKIGTDSEGRIILYPYLRRYDDGRITQPTINNRNAPT
ncbi:hypothetical protein [Uliginosibacterium sp. 31-12]|uniref:hypothetical protein n=1 Tax=Uliginosibacterium sp. 31-12 TaxID=3062781 RepID=UPI0026E3B5D5|nr:hypothetical protein [Uliginosibacterium sp. 31-12]MDO6388458.1 hypothetical protein [Uliginosibacterium sp. 31-12]